MLDTDILGRVISKIGRPGFDSAFFELARRALDISSCTAFSFEDDQTPHPIILEGHGSEQRSRTKQLGSTYVQDGYRSDPNVRDLFDVTQVEVRLTNPSEITDDAFRDHYYAEPRIGSEITILAHYNRKRYNIGLYRGTGKPPFDCNALDSARALAAVIVPALHRHIDFVMADPEQDERTGEQSLDHLAAVLLADCNKLSPREAQVCAAIVLGYRTLAISLNLGISENTICTHRKRAYAKLGISSQNELFSLYFRTVARMGASSQMARRMPQLHAVAA